LQSSALVVITLPAPSHWSSTVTSLTHLSGSSKPLCAGPHWPLLPAPLMDARQELHSPSQGSSQQTPSTQWPERHSAPIAQLSPSSFTRTWALARVVEPSRPPATSTPSPPRLLPPPFTRRVAWLRRGVAEGSAEKDLVAGLKDSAA